MFEKSVLKEEEELGNNDFIYTCSVCSLDKELWPYGSIVGNKYNVLRGTKPCGCSKAPKYSKRQWEIKVKRQCDEKGYIFEGFVGEFQKSRSKIRLFNPKTGNRWESFTIGNFINQGQEDPALRYNKISDKKIVPDKTIIDRFFDKGGFTDGYIFCRGDKSENGGFYWKYYCPYCSNDSFVKEGLCTGVFESYVSSLMIGSKACRCSNKVYNENTFKMAVREFLKEKGCIFKGLSEEFKGYTTKVEWVCKEGHTNSHTFPNMRRGMKCVVCNARNNNGLYHNRGSELDNLYVINLGFNDHFKIGRTFDLNQRIISLKRQYETDTIIPIKVFQGKHEDVYKVEQELLYEIKMEGFKYDKGKERELVKMEGLEFTLSNLYSKGFIELKEELQK